MKEFAGNIDDWNFVQYFSGVIRFAAIFFLMALPAFAGLTWLNPSMEISLKATDETATGDFQFRNDSGSAVTVTETKTSCGCTTARLEKKIYAPGETGKITAFFEVGGRVGPQVKTISVTTNDAPGKPTVLELKVDIPDPFEDMKPILIWKANETAAEQIFTVRVRDGYKINVTDIRCSNKLFTARLDSAKQGSVYQIAVRPAATDAKAFGLLIVTTDYPPKNPRVLYSQLQVQ